MLKSIASEVLFKVISVIEYLWCNGGKGGDITRMGGTQYSGGPVYVFTR